MTLSAAGGASGLHPTFQPDEHRRRWHRLQGVLQARGIACAVLGQSRNILYFAGMAVHGHVLVPADADPVLLVQIDGVRARALCPLPHVLDSRGNSTLVESLRDLRCEKATIGVEEDFLTVGAQGRLQERLPGATFVDVGADVLELRSVKSPAEIDVLAQAALISSAQFELVRQRAREGTTELDLYAQLGRLQRVLGADGLSAKHAANDRFIDHAWVVSGPNTEQVSGYWLTMTGAGPSPARPYGPTSRALRSGDLLCCDIGTALRGYHVDQARSYVLGPASDRQRRGWEALLEMQERAVEAAIPGEPASDVYDAVAAVAGARGLSKHFMTRALHDYPYVGHGVGLEIDEGPLLTPTNRTLLVEGMTLAIEPKIIIPGWGGMTLEDTVLVTSSGARLLTRAPTELELP